MSNRAQLSEFTEAPPVRRSRSVVLGCFGLLLASGFGLIVLLAVVDVATGAENMQGAIVAGACTAVLAAFGLVLTFLGFQKVSRVSKPDFSEAKVMREAFMAKVDTSDPQSQAINAAAGLMLDRRYDESRKAYALIAEQYPERRGDAYSQIGAACYFLGEYAAAIQWYEAALANGADPSDMKDNIEEARAALG